MLFRKKSKKTQYDLTNKQAVIRASICNGEQVAGFKDRTTGKFEEIMLIRNEKDIEAFKKEYGVSDITKEY